MKLFIAPVFALLLFIICHGNAVFNNILLDVNGDGIADDPPGPGIVDPFAFDLTNVLECTVDNGERLEVPIVPNANSHIVWKPEVTTFNFPENLQWAGSNIEVLNAVIGDLQGIDMAVQRLQPLADQPVGSNVPGTQPTLCNRGDPDDFEQSPLEIVRNDVEDEEAIIAQREITDTARNLSGDPNIITDSQENGLLNLFRGLRCGVVFTWADLGPTYLPRYYLGGRCFNRNCSFSFGFGQNCRPDISKPSNLQLLNALRWDCCWRYNTETEQFSFSCGWRKVAFPVLCDCDCSCPPRSV